MYFFPKMRHVSNIEYFSESLAVAVISLATLFLDHWSWLVSGMWKNSQVLSKNLLNTVGRAQWVLPVGTPMKITRRERQRVEAGFKECQKGPGLG